MLSDQLLTEVYKLSRMEKLRLVQLLVTQLAAEEEGLLQAGASYEVWSPYESGGAAALMQMLEADEMKLPDD